MDVLLFLLRRVLGTMIAGRRVVFVWAVTVVVIAIVWVGIMGRMARLIMSGDS